MKGPPLVPIVLALSGLDQAPRTFEQRYSYAPTKVGVSVSRDGRVVAFESLAPLVVADNGAGVGRRRWRSTEQQLIDASGER